MHTVNETYSDLSRCHSSPRITPELRRDITAKAYDKLDLSFRQEEAGSQEAEQVHNHDG